MRLAVITMKPCYVTFEDEPPFTDGGFPTQMRALAEIFTETTVAVPCQRTRSVEGLRVLSGPNLTPVRLSPLPRNKRLRWSVFPFWAIRNLPSIMRVARKADIVHIPLPGDVSLLGLLIAILLRKPVLARYCGQWPPSGTFARRLCKALMLHLARPPNLILATGESEAPPAPENPNIRWIFSTALESSQIAQAVPRDLPADGPVRIAFCGRVERGKGAEMLVPTVAKLLHDGVPVALDVIGDGSLLPLLRSQAVDLRVEPSVVFHGRVPQPQVLSILRQAHLFCFPSKSEGFPKAVLEAMAAGLPIVATMLPVLENLVPKEGGVLLPNPNESDLQRAILDCVSEKERYQQMSRAVITRATRYTIENWQRLIRQFLEELQCQTPAIPFL
jgi:glycosyltransferase involved in cell wall biosynthesis